MPEYSTMFTKEAFRPTVLPTITTAPPTPAPEPLPAPADVYSSPGPARGTVTTYSVAKAITTAPAAPLDPPTVISAPAITMASKMTPEAYTVATAPTKETFDAFAPKSVSEPAPVTTTGEKALDPSVSTVIREQASVAVTTPETAESETWWNLRRIGTSEPEDTGEVKTLIDEAKTTEPIIMPSTMPKVTTNPEILAASTTALKAYSASAAYGTAPATQAQATGVIEATRPPITPPEIMKEEPALDHEAMVQKAAQLAQQPTYKPLLPTGTKEAPRPVTVVEATRSSDTDYQQGSVGAAHVENMLSNQAQGIPTTPVMPDPLDDLPVMPDVPYVTDAGAGYPPNYVPREPAEPTFGFNMETVKKYAPYAAGAALLALLIRRR